MGKAVGRAILILHRYLGVAVGTLMTLWCLSGFVMMYQAYPSLEEAGRLKGLAPLTLAGCCDLSKIRLDDDARVSNVRVEMLGDRPVLRLRDPEGERAIFDLRSGTRLGLFTEAQVLGVARGFGQLTGIAGAPTSRGVIDVDQWTLEDGPRNRPIHRVSFDDPAATDIYVSGASGQVFQQTTRLTRFLGWIGAVPHWLYPTVLRRNAPLWDQVVIWTSLLGVFLTVTGLYVGISRFRRRSDGRWSPFRGWWWWHHMAGLLFGLLTLAWVGSGLLTMNPWGLLEGAGGDLRGALAAPPQWRQVKGFLAAAGPRLADMGEVKALRAVPFGPDLYVEVVDGQARPPARLDAVAAPAALSEAQVRAAVEDLGVPVRSFALMTREDDYYYREHGAAPLPVYKVVLADGQGTRLYIDARNGALLRQVDSDGRLSRWVRTGLHDFDFAPIRQRPIWDVVVILLLLGVTGLCITGLWMSLQRVGRDLKALAGWIAHLRRPRAATVPEAPPEGV